MASTERQSIDADIRERANDIIDQSWLREGMTRAQLETSAQLARRADEALGAGRPVDEVLITEAQQQTGEPEHGEIRLTAARFDKDGAPWIRIIVADNGPGVPDHIRETLFDEGGTLRADESGHGLGHYFTRQRIERAGGTVRYEPNGPAGGRLVIELPEAQ